jgi:thiamine kinase-like enzyme
MSTNNTTPDNSEPEQLIQALPLWAGPVQVDALEGGITNRNYLVTDNDRRYVVRLGADIPVHQIKRFNEIAAGKAACEAGLAPAIRHHQEGILVMDYVPSNALTEEQVRDEETLKQIITLLKKCHREVPKHLRGASLVFWVFHVIRDYAATLREGTDEVTSAHLSLLPGLLEQAATLERAAGPFDIVFGHNDLLPANILDDGKRLWLIDWEYAGFNTPLFDLGGLASNNGLDETAERWMLEQYFSTAPDDDLWRRYSAMKCASLLRETMWSMVSELHSEIDFDYSIYTRENLDRYEQSIARFNGL